MRTGRAIVGVAIVFGLAAPAMATETISYTYDAKGRLVTVVRSGTVNNGVTTAIKHDKADNRVSVTVTGASR